MHGDVLKIYCYDMIDVNLVVLKIGKSVIRISGPGCKRIVCA